VEWEEFRDVVLELREGAEEGDLGESFDGTENGEEESWKKADDFMTGLTQGGFTQARPSLGYEDDEDEVEGNEVVDVDEELEEGGDWWKRRSALYDFDDEEEEEEKEEEEDYYVEMKSQGYLTQDFQDFQQRIPTTQQSMDEVDMMEDDDAPSPSSPPSFSPPPLPPDIPPCLTLSLPNPLPTKGSDIPPLLPLTLPPQPKPLTSQTPTSAYLELGDGVITIGRRMPTRGEIKIWRKDRKAKWRTRAEEDAIDSNSGKRIRVDDIDSDSDSEEEEEEEEEEEPMKTPSSDRPNSMVSPPSSTKSGNKDWNIRRSQAPLTANEGGRGLSDDIGHQGGLLHFQGQGGVNKKATGSVVKARRTRRTIHVVQSHLATISPPSLPPPRRF
jgi:hypothetical protein